MKCILCRLYFHILLLCVNLGFFGPIKSLDVQVIVYDDREGKRKKGEKLFDAKKDWDTHISDVKKKISEEKKIPLHEQKIIWLHGDDLPDKSPFFAIDSFPLVKDMWQLYIKNPTKEVVSAVPLWQFCVDTPIEFLLQKKKLDSANKIEDSLKKYCNDSDAIFIAYGSASNTKENAIFQQFPDFFSTMANENKNKKFTIILIDGFFEQKENNKNLENNIPIGLLKEGWEEGWEKNTEDSVFRVYKKGNITALIIPINLNRTDDNRNVEKPPYIKKQGRTIINVSGGGDELSPEEDPITCVFSNYFTTLVNNKNKAIIFAYCVGPRTYGKIRESDYFHFINDFEIKRNNIYAYSPWNDIHHKNQPDYYPPTPLKIVWDENGARIQIESDSSLQKSLSLMQAKLLQLATQLK